MKSSCITRTQTSKVQGNSNSQLDLGILSQGLRVYNKYESTRKNCTAAAAIQKVKDEIGQSRAEVTSATVRSNSFHLALSAFMILPYHHTSMHASNNE